MKSRLFLYLSSAAILCLACLATGIAMFVRPPSEAAGPRVVEDVEKTGQLRFLVSECTVACRAAILLTAESPQSEYNSIRAKLRTLSDSSQRLQTAIEGTNETWIPVDEAALLLEDAAQVLSITLSKIPTVPVPEQVSVAAHVLVTDVDKVGLTPESKLLIENQLQRLEEQSREVRANVEQSVLMASRAKESIIGFETKYVLLTIILFSSCISLLTTYRASVTLSVPPGKALESQLKLKARLHPTQAIEGCYDQSRRILQVADEIFTKSKLLQTRLRSSPNATAPGESDG